MRWLRLLWLVPAWFCIALPALADELRPGYLEISQQNAHAYAVLWKQPLPRSGRPRVAGLQLRMPAVCKRASAVQEETVAGAMLQRWYLHCEQPLAGQSIGITGLDASNTDVLLRIRWQDGNISSSIIRPASPLYRIPAQSSHLAIALNYLQLGTEHILAGIDHLLFVLALILIVRGWRQLLLTITAFTIAHSITLAAATLELVHVPQAPVEAVIALSILFLAVEIVRAAHGQKGYAYRMPWLVAFLFGLLHGFGFAGALAEVGLPQQAIPLALVFFNIGVEIGQLLFVAMMLFCGAVFTRLTAKHLIWRHTKMWKQKTRLLLVYLIGSLSAFWFFSRIALF